MVVGVGTIWIVAVLLWAAFVIVAVFRRGGPNHSVEIKARDISGVVVGGDVKGDVVQTQRPAQEPSEEPAGFWKPLGRAGLVLGMLAAMATIIGLIVTLMDRSP